MYEEPRAVRMEPEYEAPRERVRSYRELPPHRMPDYYNDKYEEAQPVEKVFIHYYVIKLCYLIYFVFRLEEQNVKL